MTDAPGPTQIPGLDGLLGVEHLEQAPDRVVARFTIGEQHLQPFGIPHGGVYCTVHESTASFAAQLWLGRRGFVVGTHNSTDFIRQARVGSTITVTATPVHRGRSRQLWHLDSVDEEGRLVAQGQVRLANVEQEAPPEMLDRLLGATDAG